jgi:hypothetical protein
MAAQVPGTDAAGRDIALELARAEEALVDSLEALVPWCTDQRLFATREELCDDILELDPESEVAHEGLLHKRNKDGEWEPPKKRSPAKDYKQSKLPEYRERLAETAGAYVEAVSVLCRPPTGRAACTHPPCPEAIQRALTLDPEDPALRGLVGETRDGEEWVLDETIRARARRAELKELVQAAYAEVPAPEEIEPLEKELATGVAWKTKLRTPLVRVMSTGERDDAVRMARAVHATILVFRRVLDVETELDRFLTVYVLTSEPERAKFVAGWPTWGPDAVEPTRAFVGAGVPLSQHTARWDPDPANRLDGAVRHVLGELLREEFDLDMGAAWAWEGVGIYLTRELVGTRRTWYGSADGLDAEAKELVARLVTIDDVNWMNEAYQRIMTGQGTPPEELLARPIDQLGVYDMVQVYALAGYLIEGQAERLAELLRTAARDGAEEPVVFDLVLGRPLEDTYARFVRWMRERR